MPEEIQTQPEQTRYLCPYQQCDIYKRFRKILSEGEIPNDGTFSLTVKAPVVCNNPTASKLHFAYFFCDAVRVYNKSVNHEGDKLPECSHIRILNKLERIMFT